MALDKFQPYLFVSAGEQSNKYLTPVYSDGIASFQAQRAQDLTGLTVRIDPIQEGTGDPSPTNIRPISGRTGMTVTRCGKNLFAPLTSGGHVNNGITWTYNADGTITANGTATGNSWSYANDPKQVILAGTYTVSVSSPFGIVVQNLTDGGFLYNGTNNKATFTVGKATTIIIHARVGNETTVNNATTGIQLEVGSTATAYEPYAHTTYPVTWQTEAGTVYGGTLNVTTGVLTVKGVLKTLTGNEDFSLATNSRRFQKAFSTLGWERANTVLSTQNQSNSVCSHATYLTGATGTATPADYRISNDASNAQAIVFYDTQSVFANTAAFNSYLAEQYTNGTPVQVYYDLATPQTYQLTPTEVRTIAGFNQIYSDAGPVIDIKF